MLSISWPMNVEQVVSRPVDACVHPVVDYRDREPNGSLRGDRRVDGSPRGVGRAFTHFPFAYLTVNPLAPRPRAKHG